jgi:uncharacterized protein YabE (DUF348 family)
LKGGREMNTIYKVGNWIHKHLKDSLMVMFIALMVGGLLLHTVSKFNKDIVVVIDGISQNYNTSRAKVTDALNALNIKVEAKDKISPALGSSIKDGMTIRIDRAVPIVVTLDGKNLKINSAEKTISDMFKSEGIVLNDKDKVIPKLDSSLKSGLEIKVVRVYEKIITSTSRIPYTTINRLTSSIERGKVKVLQDGADGAKEVVTMITYEDGKEVSRTKVMEVVKKQPVTKVVAVGTLAWFTPSRGGRRILYTKSLKMKATSYTSNYACTGKRPGDRGFGITATGTRAKRDRNGYSTVAVDPRVIPLGTKLFIEGYGYARAEDTGGAVRSNIIDLYFEPGTAEFRNWYTHYVKVYILK